MRDGKSELTIYDEIIVPASKKVTMDQFIENYNSRKMIAVCSNNQKNLFTKVLGEHKKYRVNNCFVLGT